MKFKDLKKKKAKRFSSPMSKLQLSFLIPYIIFAILFIILPMVFVCIYAFKPLEGQTKLENWEIAIKPSTWIIIGRSLLTGILAAFVALIIGFPYAYIVSRSKYKIIKILGLTLILSPLAIFTISKALAVRGLFSAIFDENQLNNNFFIIFGMIYLYLPFMVLPLYQVLKDMPNNILEASEDLGYSKFQTVFKVIIPYSSKAILSGFGIVLMMSATSIIISDKLLPNGSQKQLIGNLINQFANTANPFDLANASTLVIITLSVLLSIYAVIYGIPYLIRKRKQGGNYE
ncbi:ABC transporter permease [Mycoplasmopsis arginini]|uniref:ABC transporter permease n=1 Tax=Mycoplasmopsis arginini TaxID=2094 RepID=UPI0002D19E09|nr:ABC transporter permease [Mycoplasmopsis arginini]ENY69639.1 Spermidine/putrescine ABC transporter permease protein potB [Mycoplasmopsis arginini 7264]MCY2902676.1 ABC transporter permease [Mycoplasmopsis arginini QMP CG1-2758]MDI3348763.1 ABC transporter permease [Mycoplasmopsis arginini]MDI3350335.1 ABC transporter permease [Mycoplasmopsis arginini]MDI3350958.1 ABC transporter permease [Mycoplasmopsis arginini]